MFECPSCQQALPRNARFCAHCGQRLPVKTTIALPPVKDREKASPDLPGQPSLEATSAGGPPEEISLQLISQIDGSCESEVAQSLAPTKQEEMPAHLATFVGFSAHIKRELAAQCTDIISAMDSLLPFVYENHRAENQALFADTLASKPPLEDAVWGRIAFTLGAYGNYMHRYSLNAEQKRQVWRALLWAVYYERCYRRKYLAPRCQQMLHFLQGCADDTVFVNETLDDLDTLCPYLEAGSLKTMQATLQQLPVAHANLLQHVSEQLILAEQRKQARVENTVPIDGKKAERARQLNSPQKSDGGEQSTPGNMNAQGHQRGKNREQGPGLSREKNQEPSPTRGNTPQSVPLSELAPGTRQMLRFFTDEQCLEFFASLRGTRLETITRLLQEARGPLLAALRQELLAACPVEYQAPRRPIRLGKKQADRFAEACRLLASSQRNDQQSGLRLFEQGARETTHPDYHQLAREWMLYARAVIQGGHRAVNDWESDLQHDKASWEEDWNLAFFYWQTGHQEEALRILKPGLDELRAPVVHLRFALTCALDLLLEEREQATTPTPARQAALTFLLAHLEHWPHPLSCLAWLPLAHETYGSLHPRQQSQRLSTFQELIEHPLNLPDPQKDLPETRVMALEDTMVEKAHCEEAWLLWINDYAERHPRKYPAWIRLAETSEGLQRLEAAETALQHVVEIQYHNDYAHYQEGTPLPRAEYLRRNLERLFEFYQRHSLTAQGTEAFQSCYPSLGHLWDTHESANHRLISLTRPYLEAHLRAEKQAGNARHERGLRDLSRTATVPLEPFKPGLRVGIFVDYENIARFIPPGIDVEEVGKALANYAAHFGEVVCQWASASPQNLSNLADVRLGLEAAHFKVRFPRRELQFSPSKKNLADFALLECLSEARATDRPDIYLIVSGDRDYYERICSLLDAGHTVRILASTDSQHLSSRYRELQRARQAIGHEESDFFIDDLEEILYPLVSLN